MSAIRNINFSVLHCLFRAEWLIYLPLSLRLQKCYVLPTQCIYVFRMDLRTNSDYFTKRH